MNATKRDDLLNLFLQHLDAALVPPPQSRAYVFAVGAALRRMTHQGDDPGLMRAYLDLSEQQRAALRQGWRWFASALADAGLSAASPPGSPQREALRWKAVLREFAQARDGRSPVTSYQYARTISPALRTMTSLDDDAALLRFYEHETRPRTTRRNHFRSAWMAFVAFCGARGIKVATLPTVERGRPHAGLLKASCLSVFEAYKRERMHYLAHVKASTHRVYIAAVRKALSRMEDLSDRDGFLLSVTPFEPLASAIPTAWPYFMAFCEDRGIPIVQYPERARSKSAASPPATVGLCLLARVATSTWEERNSIPIEGDLPLVQNDSSTSSATATP